ncbi:MAG TPA: hypothetical protein VD793_08850, partial [Gemmatimonadales bacterium]|nr:hypothetical protein [Gemmatimonadales bacterium]
MRSVPAGSPRGPLTHALVSLILLVTLVGSALAQGARRVTFRDVQDMRSFGSETPSPDGRWMLYTITTPDWESAREQSDIYLVSVTEGLGATRQMTFTKQHNETSPQWTRDGRFFAFLSNREVSSDAGREGRAGTGGSGGGNASEGRGRQNQIYLLRPDGGEARRITDARDGVANFAFSKDGRWLVYRAGKSGEQQLYRLSVQTIVAGDAEPEQLTRQPAGVGTWAIAPDSRRVYFVAPDSADPDEARRLEEDFSATVYHMDKPLESLWAVNLDPVNATQLTRDPAYSVTGFTISPDSRWVGFRGVSSDRFKRTRGGTIMGGESNLYTEL